MANDIDPMTNQYMQISGRSTQARGPERATDASTSTSGGRPTGGTQGADTIQLTDEARLLQSVEQRLSEVSEVNQERVADIRSRVNSGDYQVSAERTAAKMLLADRGMPQE